MAGKNSTPDAPGRAIVTVNEAPGRAARPRGAALPAVAGGRLHEIKSPLILQPGPAALTDGLDALVAALWEPAPAGGGSGQPDRRTGPDVPSNGKNRRKRLI